MGFDCLPALGSLACYIGLSREITNKTLSRLELEGAIKVRHGVIDILDPFKLEHRVEI